MVIEESLEEGEEECIDLPRDHANRLHKDANVLSRLEEVPGEEKFQDHPKGAEDISQRCHDNNNEREQSDSLISRGTLRTLRCHDNNDEREQSDSLTSRGTLRDRSVVEKEVNDTSLDKCSRVASVILSDNELGNLEGNGLSIYRFDNNQENVFDRETASSHGLLRFRGSGGELKRKVGWNLETRSTSEDGDSWRRNVSNYHTERLLVIGSCKHGDVRRCIPLSGGANEEQVRNSQRECESDEGSNSLQSISSSASCSSDNSSRVASDLKPLVSYVYEDAEIQTPEDEVEVDLHPTGESAAVNLDQLSAQLRRSATFPPPSAPGYANGGKKHDDIHLFSKEVHII
jgi:hypothetical protein